MKKFFHVVKQCVFLFYKDIGDLETLKPAEAEVEKVVGENGLNLLVNNAGSDRTSMIVQNTKK